MTVRPTEAVDEVGDARPRAALAGIAHPSTAGRPLDPPAWWSDFSRHHAVQDTPRYYPTMPGGALLSVAELEGILTLLAASPQRPRRMRVYTEGGRRDDVAARFLAEVGDGPPLDRLRELAQTDRVAFMINDLQDWSEPLSSRAARFLEGLFAVRGCPPNGVELVCFAGNYAETPFGVHRGYEHASLAHVGPGTKTFHVWSAETIERLTGSLDDIFDWEHLRPHATTFELEPGSLFYLPANVFHIAEQDSFSISVAVCLNQLGPRRVLRGMLDALPDDEQLLPYLSWESGIADLAGQLALAAEDVGRRTADFAAVLHGRHRSNGGLVSTYRPPRPAPPVSADRMLRRVQPYELVVHHGARRTVLFARHQRVLLPTAPELEGVVELIHSDGVFSAAEIVQLLPGWEQQAVFALLHRLVALGALDLAEVDHD